MDPDFYLIEIGELLYFFYEISSSILSIGLCYSQLIEICDALIFYFSSTLKESLLCELLFPTKLLT